MKIKASTLADLLSLTDEEKLELSAQLKMMVLTKDPSVSLAENNSEPTETV